MVPQIRANTNKAYVALQTYVTSPAPIAIPGVVHTDRPHLTREQIAARYLKSVEGNPDIDINKAESGRRGRTPKMVQKPAKSLNEAPRLIDSHSRTAEERKAHQTSRTLLEINGCWTTTSFETYRTNGEKSGELVYELVDADLHNACMDDLPEFIICGDKYLSMTNVEGWYPKQVLNYRGTSVRNYCKLESDNCPKPATTPEKINLQINELLKKDKATRIYLTQAQHESYLFWRLMHGGQIKFPHIRVEDNNQYSARKMWFILGGLGVASTSFFICMAIDLARRASKNNGDSQQMNCINRSPADQQRTTEDKKNKIDDPSESSTSSSIIIESVDSTTEDPEDAEVRIDVET